MCQLSENLDSSMNQYFTKSHMSKKNSFKRQDKPINFNVTKYKFTDKASDSTLQLTCMKLPAVNFWCRTREEPGYL